MGYMLTYLKNAHTLMFKKHTEGHASTYLKSVTIATFNLGQL